MTNYFELYLGWDYTVNYKCPNCKYMWTEIRFIKSCCHPDMFWDEYHIDRHKNSPKKLGEL